MTDAKTTDVTEPTDEGEYDTSPYLNDDVIERKPQRVTKEQFYTEKETELISKFFVNREVHLKHLFKLYKFIQPAAKPRKKPLYEKTEEDVLKDIMSTKGYSLNMDSLADSVSSDVAESMFNAELFHKQLDCVPLFVDFAYMYYVRFYCDDSPVLKLPAFMPKFRMIMAVLKTPSDELQACFEQCIENEIIADMRQEVPPYYLRTDLSEDEIREKMKLLVLPMFKDILRHLIGLGKTKKITLKPSEVAKDSITIEARADNLDVQPDVQPSEVQ